MQTLTSDTPENYACTANQWARVWGNTVATGTIRASANDFKVREELGIEPSGSGEHALLWIEKTNLTTVMVSEAIAAVAGVSGRNVSYAGLKDKRAVTQQAFSVHLPGKPDPDWAALERLLQKKIPNSALQVLSVQRHQRKIKTGAHQANHFEITVRDLSSSKGQSPPNFSKGIADRIQQIAQHGVANYFGEQRFGHQGENVSKAAVFLNGKKRLSKSKRGIYLSAIRAFLFNHMLAQRIRDNNWCTALDGDYLSLSGSQSFFKFEPSEDDKEDSKQLMHRIESGDLHLSGLLYGEDYRQNQSSAGQYEANIIEQYPALIAILQNARLKMARRAFRVIPKKLEYTQHDERTLELSFELPPGSYATVVLSELFNYHTVSAN
jgi:tRNA pseudouridine13 synthase